MKALSPLRTRPSGCKYEVSLPLGFSAIQFLWGIRASLVAQMVICLQYRSPGFNPWVGRIPWRRKWHPTPVPLPGKSHGWRSLVGCSPWGREESDITERLPFHFSLSCIGEGNGNPLQCSCLENPRDGGAWWAAVYGVTQSRTQLKRLSSSSSSPHLFLISSASVRSIPFLSFIEPIFA